jgi:hypothetical protein
MPVKKLLVLALFLAAMLPLPAFSADSLAQFQGGIGVIPVSSATVNADGSVTVNRNVVRGVNPPGQPWVIADLQADVKVDGHIKVDGRGLLLAGGNGIGGNGGQRVFATLICAANEQGQGPFTLHSTNNDVVDGVAVGGVPLAPNGDFRIDDMLSPTPPADCFVPVLLIRSVLGKTWFAAGIPK